MEILKGFRAPMPYFLEVIIPIATTIHNTLYFTKFNIDLSNFIQVYGLHVQSVAHITPNFGMAPYKGIPQLQVFF